MGISRRGLLIGAAAGGGLLVAYGLRPDRARPLLRPDPDETAFNAWIKIARDGAVGVAVPQCCRRGPDAALAGGGGDHLVGG